MEGFKKNGRETYNMLFELNCKKFNEIIVSRILGRKQTNIHI